VPLASIIFLGIQLLPVSVYKMQAYQLLLASLLLLDYLQLASIIFLGLQLLPVSVYKMQAYQLLLASLLLLDYLQYSAAPAVTCDSTVLVASILYLASPNLAEVTVVAHVPSVHEILAVDGILCTLANFACNTSVAGVLAFAGVPAVAEPLTLTSTV
jgi:hypothetical protein